MHVQVRLRGLEVPDVARQAITRRIHLALGRFGGRLRLVSALAFDENGPRGGTDKRCRIELRLRDGGYLSVEHTGERLLATVDEALGRAVRALVRHLERARDGRINGPEPAALQAARPAGAA